jgi:hypothetical protein
MASDLVLVPNVRAVSDGLALICELPDKRRIGVPTPSSTSRAKYGALVTTERWSSRDSSRTISASMPTRNLSAP